MKNNRFYVGNIMECTQFDVPPIIDVNAVVEGCSFCHIENNSVLYKENAILLQTKHGYFVEIEDLSLSDIIYLYVEDCEIINHGDKSSKLFMTTYPYYKGSKHVDRSTIKPYESENKNKDKSSIRKIQKKEEKKRAR